MTEKVIMHLVGPLSKARGWMKFAGVLLMIQGGITALSIVGILVAWLPIWMGLLLYKASDQIGEAERLGSEAALQGALERLATYFKIFGILLLIALVLGLASVVAALLIPSLVSLQPGSM
ncbi:DUF5362 domain-containing protein [Thiorhodovibrio frisius]|uniref:Uncharacterized protein n=1 Tax=Thiorhodovibrio frisius TaxID=631362 RepID=H8Z6G9_9GAMM|nr:DUF5362 domain-containing protein [Thiorhodovibrio frisius]EIC19667.1 hypothetical protein Thi970DRAFT_03257 [Thiorhodovibrio frisius]WPL20365.1 hypothetical protein Thiofri_00452 [Thiorhodovibrio frisius]